MNICLKNLEYWVRVAEFSELDSRWNSDNFIRSSRLIPYCRLYMPLEGEGRIEFNNTKYVLQPGYMYFIPPFTRTHVQCPERLVKYWAHFNVRAPNVSPQSGAW